MRTYRPEEITPSVLGNLKYEPITPEELDEILTQARALYTEDELQHHLEIDEGIPALDVLNEIEEAQRQFNEKAK